MSTTNTLDLNNRIDVLEKIAHNVEPIQQQIDELKAWTDPGTKDVNGNPIILTDGAAFNAEGLVVTCNPKQNLHGYDHPWAGGAGKNKLPMTVALIKALNTDGTWTGNSYVVNNVTFTIITDSDNNVTSIKVNGTANAKTLFVTAPYFTDFLTNGVSYTINGNASGYPVNTAFLQVVQAPASGQYNVDDSYTFTYNNATQSDFKLCIRMESEKQANNLIFYPMIRLASVSDATFAPYSNECPITGYTECVVEVKDEDETTQRTATITFGQTVYGGSVDFKTGKVTVTHEIVDLGSLTWSAIDEGRLRTDPIANNIDYTANQIFNGEAEKYEKVSINTMNGIPSLVCICSYQKRFYVRTGDSTEPSGNVVYELATPIELTLTPAELELLKGYNYITTNGDNIDLTYQPDNLKADILLTVSQLYGSKISIFDGILTGGDTGQVLTKTSDDNYDATWETLPATRSTTKKSEK